MRYQRFSPPDCHPLSNGRKPNVRICKEDDIENGKIQSYSNHTQVPGPLEGKALRFRSGTSSTSQDHGYAQVVSEPLQPSENHSLKSFVPETPGDVLLQWGQNKRSRGSRTENRVVADESSVQARQVIKIPRRVPGSEKPSSANQAQTTPYTRGTNLRPCTPIRETTCSVLNRTLEDRSGPGNGSPSGNGGRNIPRGSDKRPLLPSPEKTDKPAGSCAEKSNWHTADPANLESTPSEPEAGAAAEKLNLDLFEWPRIYISLSRKEKEDDFLAMKGTKLPQRPKKRAKNVDKTLQYCFPGMFLSDMSRGRYEVREKKCVKKKRRGLKGMESMDSDSE